MHTRKQSQAKPIVVSNSSHPKAHADEAETAGAPQRNTEICFKLALQKKGLRNLF